MSNRKFNNLYHRILENITTTSAGVCSNQASTIQSSDTYAPGDSRVPTILGKKNKRNKPYIIRRTPVDTI